MATGETASPFIRVQALQQVYKTEDGEPIRALQDVSFTVERGEFICVVGPSGCGKSTLLKIFAGLMAASDGTIAFEGAGGAASDARKNVGVVFQDAVLLPWLNVLDNVLIPARVQKLDMDAHRRRALALLDLVGGLAQFKDKYPDELSGGMRQRVSISRALLHDPSLLLMDEPFGALDAMTREHMALELQRIWMESRKTVLFITHSISEAVFLGDRVLVMSPRPGRIVDDIRIDLPRPRPLRITGTSAFGDYTNHIRTLLSASEGFAS